MFNVISCLLTALTTIYHNKPTPEYYMSILTTTAFPSYVTLHTKTRHFELKNNTTHILYAQKIEQTT